MHICRTHCSGFSESVRQVCSGSWCPLKHIDGLVNRLWRGQSHLRYSADLPGVHRKQGARAGPLSHPHIHSWAVRLQFRFKGYLSAHVDPFFSYPHGKKSSEILGWLSCLGQLWAQRELQSQSTCIYCWEEPGLTMKVSGIWLVGLFTEAMSSLAGRAAGLPRLGKER